MENKRPYWQVGIRLLFSLAATAAFVIIGIKAIGFLMPFVIGWIISAVAAPLVNWLEKRLRIVKKLGSALIVILVLGGIVGILYLGISRLILEVASLVRDFPSIYAQLESGLSQIGDTLSGVFDRLPEVVQNGWNTVASNLDQYMGKVVSGISEPTVSAAGNIAKRVPYYLVSFVVAIMSAYFFIVQREDVLAWLKKVAPVSVQKRMTLVSDNLKYALGGYFKAQFKIMLVIFVILLAGFSLIGIHFSILLAIGIAFLDFLPFFGTGTALIPWAVYKFMVGDYRMVVALVIIYVVSQLVHQLIQPKLVGDSIGLNPLFTLVLIYIGYKIGSVFGMIFAVPVGMIVLNLYKAGAFDYILDDVMLLTKRIMDLREPE